MNITSHAHMLWLAIEELTTTCFAFMHAAVPSLAQMPHNTQIAGDLIGVWYTIAHRTRDQLTDSNQVGIEDLYTNRCMNIIAHKTCI